MFAVPGWSVSSSTLKTQRPEVPKASGGQLTSGNEGLSGESISTSSKKRKRSHGKTKSADVNSTNLAELWETVIEGQGKLQHAGSAKQRPPKRERAVKRPKDDRQEPPTSDDIASSEVAELKKEKRKQKVTKSEKDKQQPKSNSQFGEASHVAAIHTGPSHIPQTSVASAQLTPLQASMRQKLISARFRHLNQTLYTTPSAHSLELFQQNPEMFHEYHEGFRRQVEVWPENPVDDYIRQVRERGRQRAAPRKSGSGDIKPRTLDVMPLPRTDGVCRIADLGCGDAGLSKGLDNEKKKLKIEIFSYDLQSPSPLVIKADIRNLPLDDNSVDVAIFCLALMGTNWIDFIEEAFRILRWKGELWVAEIKSRFGRVGGKGRRVEHSVGNRKKPDKKALKAQESATDDADLMIEVDGHDDYKQETDVSAFIEVLKKRGFVLQNENAVDLSNKMFVKMSFAKALTPMKGQHVPVPKGMAEAGIETWKKKPKSKFVEDDTTPLSSEASVLKPCVYKIR